MKRFDVVTEGDFLTLRLDVGEVVKGLRAQIEHWRGKAEHVRKQWEESEWFLGEARISLESLQTTHRALEADHRELTARFEETLRQRNEANWYLGESQNLADKLHLENQQLAEQLGQQQREVEELRRLLALIEDRLGVEAAQRRTLEADLAAVRTHGERRGAARTGGPTMTAELHSPDGVLLYRGIPRNVSRTGFAFASDYPILEIPEFVEVTFRVPGIERPIEAIGRLAWHEQSPTEAQYLGGCELLDMPADGVEIFERVLAEANGSGRPVA